MIRYSLKCSDGHSFESWFQSADAFDTLAKRGLVACVACGSTDVKKALMAPKVAAKSNALAPAKPLSTPETEVETKIAAMRRKVESEATYVGGKFAEEARRMHETQTEAAIYGEANASEIKSLLQDGVPIAPLPFLPKSKAN